MIALDLSVEASGWLQSCTFLGSGGSDCRIACESGGGSHSCSLTGVASSFNAGTKKLG